MPPDSQTFVTGETKDGLLMTSAEPAGKADQVELEIVSLPSQAVQSRS